MSSRRGFPHSLGQWRVADWPPFLTCGAACALPSFRDTTFHWPSRIARCSYDGGITAASVTRQQRTFLQLGTARDKVPSAAAISLEGNGERMVKSERADLPANASACTEWHPERRFSVERANGRLGVDASGKAAINDNRAQRLGSLKSRHLDWTRDNCSRPTGIHGIVTRPLILRSIFNSAAFTIASQRHTTGIDFQNQHHPARFLARHEEIFADLETLRWGRDQLIRRQGRAPFGFTRRFEGDNEIPPSVRRTFLACCDRHQLRKASLSVKVVAG